MSPRVAVLVEQRYQSQAQPAGLIRALGELGATVQVHTDAELPTRFHGVDVVVGRGRSDALLAGLSAAQSAGVPTVDPASAIAAVRDKTLMGTLLDSADLLVPRTWAGTPAHLSAQFAAPGQWPGPGQLIAKPAWGDNSRGVAVLERHEQLAALCADQPWLVQELIPFTGADLKLYVIGEDIWAVRKPSPVLACRAAELGSIAVTPAMRRIAAVCGELFGLSLYGVDCVLRLDADGAEQEIVVIEVNDFPTYTAVSDADHRLAVHVLSRIAS
ncbi:MAG: hypothetical protein Q4G34_07285 [Micrococcus sp.]|nr:hypothetical protein [Micrococcus sp.]